MDHQAYIQSGILEAYALGALSPAEVAEVEAHVAASPVLRAELENLQESLRAFAEASPKTPPPHLEAQIWQAIEATRSNVRTLPPPSASDAAENTGARVIPMPDSGRGRAAFTYARAAAVAALLGSLALNAYLWNDRQIAQDRIARLEARSVRQATFFASNMEARDRRISSYARMQELMTDPAVTTVRLENLNQDAQRATMIFQNRQTGEAYLAVKTLPPPPPGKQYQLWVLESGTPRGIALLQTSEGAESLDQLQMVPVSVDGGEAFAISIENAGGSLTPTMEQIVMLGKVSS